MPIPLDDLEEVIEGIATMKKEGQFVSGHQFQLLLEVDALDVGIAKLKTIVVEATFADGHHLIPVGGNVRVDAEIVPFRIGGKVVATSWMASNCDK